MDLFNWILSSRLANISGNVGHRRHDWLPMPLVSDSRYPSRAYIGLMSAAWRMWCSLAQAQWSHLQRSTFSFIPLLLRWQLARQRKRFAAYTFLPCRGTVYGGLPVKFSSGDNWETLLLQTVIILAAFFRWMEVLSVTTPRRKAIVHTRANEKLYNSAKVIKMQKFSPLSLDQYVL